jgi:hypothetical protein
MHLFQDEVGINDEQLRDKRERQKIILTVHCAGLQRKRSLNQRNSRVTEAINPGEH